MNVERIELIYDNIESIFLVKTNDETLCFKTVSDANDYIEHISIVKCKQSEFIKIKYLKANLELYKKE